MVREGGSNFLGGSTSRYLRPKRTRHFMVRYLRILHKRDCVGTANTEFMAPKEADLFLSCI